MVEQELDYFQIALSAGPVHQGAVLIVKRVDVGPSVDQQPDEFAVALPDGQSKRRRAIATLRIVPDSIRVGPAVKKQLGHRDVATLDCIVERGLVIQSFHVDVGAVVKQELDDLKIALAGGPAKRGWAIFDGGVYVGAAVEQQPGRFDVARLGGTVKRRVVKVIHGAHVRALVEQYADYFDVSRGGVMEATLTTAFHPFLFARQNPEVVEVDVASGGSVMKRRNALAIAPVRVGAVIQQQHGEFDAPAGGGVMKRRHATVAAPVHVGTCFNEATDCFHVSALGCPVEAAFPGFSACHLGSAPCAGFRSSGASGDSRRREPEHLADQ